MMKGFMLKVFSVILTLAILGISTGAAAKYKMKEIVVRPALEYPAHQESQSVTIAVRPCLTEAEILDILDTKKLYERRIMPVIVVIENRNDFAVRIDENDIFLIKPDGSTMPTLELQEVLLRVSLKKPLSSYSTREDILLSQSVKTDIRADFERKSFGEKLVAPHDSDYGVVFFDMPEEASGHRVFIPEIRNMRDGEKLMFFEFSLLASPE